MPAVARFPQVAVDIGNSRIKFGLFESAPAAVNPPAPALPVPSRTFDFAPQPHRYDELTDWLAPYAPPDVSWWIGSVERTSTTQLVDWLRLRDASRITLLASIDLPLVVSLPRPDMVGIDRLLAAVASNHIRLPEAPAIVIDLGTAITVDLISEGGAFLGGAILPGIGLSARALYEFTDLLPELNMSELAEPPPVLGRATIEAMRSGIYWGAVGGVRQLIELLAAEVAAAPQIFLTGGAAPAVAGLLSPSVVYEPHLTLAGIALTAAAGG